MNLHELAVARQPTWFVVLEVIELGGRPVGSFEAPAAGVQLVRFGDGELSHPGADPIGVLGDGKGDRVYLWRNAEWREYPVLFNDWANQLDETTRAIVQQIHSWRGPMTPGSCWRALYRWKT